MERIVVGIGQCYLWRHLWRDGADVTLVDTGPPGSADAVLAAVGDARVLRIVLTHFHGDHAGSAAELRARTGAEVLVHAADAPALRGDVPPPEPVLLPAEEELFAQVGGLLAGPPCPVDRELSDGDEIGAAQVIHTPGHTDGSIALHLREHRVLVTGDTVASHEGRAILGPFNRDTRRALESFRALVALDVDRAYVGHGEPLNRDGLRGAVPGPFAGPGN